jgi:hypothetical protein
MLLFMHAAALGVLSSFEHSAALKAFSSLFPEADYSLRNAASRTDGYWPFVSRKESPPKAFTYGEFPLPYFTRVTDRACELVGLDAADAVLCDLGSGAGRLVLWAAATRKWKEVRGVELLPSLHKAACEHRDEARLLLSLGLQTPSISLLEGSWDDADLMVWSEIDVAFAYATAFPHDGYDCDGVLTELSASLVPRLREGCIVCTTDYRMGDGFELLETMVGENDGVGSVSTVYLHRKTVPGVRASEHLDARVDRMRARVSSLEAQLAESKARSEELTERIGIVEAERDALRVERDELAERIEDAEAASLLALKDWAAGTGYISDATLGQTET